MAKDCRQTGSRQAVTVAHDCRLDSILTATVKSDQSEQILKRTQIFFGHFADAVCCPPLQRERTVSVGRLNLTAPCSDQPTTTGVCDFHVTG